MAPIKERAGAGRRDSALYMTWGEQQRTLSGSGAGGVAAGFGFVGFPRSCRGAPSPLPIVEFPNEDLPDCHRRWLQEVSDFRCLPGEGRHRRLQERRRRAGESCVGSAEGCIGSAQDRVGPAQSGEAQNEASPVGGERPKT